VSKSKARGGVFALATKVGAKLIGVLPKLFKLLKVGKLTLAAASVGAYSLIFTWQFALIIIGMLVVHEYGHLLMMKRYGMKTRGIYLIPFLGAAAVADEEFADRRSEAVIAMAGPLTGAALAVLSGLLYAATDWPYLAAAAAWMAGINLFNLLPVSPLDGGRVMKSVTISISSRLGLGFMIVMLVVGVALAVKAELIIFVVLIPFGIIDFILERRRERRSIGTPKPRMSRTSIQVAFASYVALAIALWLFILLMANQPGAHSAMHTLQG